MTVVRLCTRKYPELDGTGASVTGGRWNSAGKRVIYTASCAALAILEGFVHMKTLPANLLLLNIEIPNTLRVESVSQAVTEVKGSQQLGDEWLTANESAVLSVPSVIAPRQRNYLLNPAHKLFEAIQVTERSPFVMDSRLVGHLSAILAEAATM